MTVKSEVQGIVQALFGAYAGGYLAELTAEATANGSSAVAARLVTIQGVILGRDMSANQTFVDTMLHNLGVSSTNAAYAAASKWAMDELTAGANRGDIVSAAVAFLEGIAAGTIVDSNYTAIATAFAAKVEEGIEESEGALAKELSLTSLQTAAGITSVFNLTAALDTLSAANDAVTANIKAWGLANKDTTPTSAEIYNALEGLEAKLAIAAANADLGINSPTDLDEAEQGNFKTYNGKDSDEALALTIAQSQIATKKLALDGALASAVTALEAVTTSDKTGSLKTLVDTYLAQAKAVGTAVKAQVLTANTVESKGAAADISLDIALDKAPANYTFNVDATVSGLVVFDGGNAYGEYTAVYNSTTNAWSYKLGGTALTTAAAAADTKLQALLANADAKSLLDAVAADSEAIASITSAQDAAAATLVKITTVSNNLANGTTWGSALTNTASDYSVAVTALADHATAKAAFDKAIAAVEAARTDAAALAGLEKAVDVAIKAIIKGGWNAQNLDGISSATDTLGTNNSDLADDVFIFNGESAQVVNFDLTGTDMIKFAAGKYTLVEVKAANWMGGADEKAVGSATALEIFLVDDGNDTFLYVEENAFDGSTVAAQGNAIEVRLVGVEGEDFVLATNGYLTIA